MVHRTTCYGYYGWTIYVVCHCFNMHCYSALMKGQRLFKVVGTRENNIDRTSLFAIVIIVAQPCEQVVTVLMVEQ